MKARRYTQLSSGLGPIWGVRDVGPPARPRPTPGSSAAPSCDDHTSNRLLLRERARALLLDLLNHQLADEERMVAVRAELERSIVRLRELDVEYDKVRASVHRKRAVQFSDALRAPGKAYSAFDEDAVSLESLVRCSIAPPDPRGLPDDVDASLLGSIPVAQWLGWLAMPVRRRRSGALLVAIPNPRDGFLLSEIAKAVGSRVEA